MIVEQDRASSQILLLIDNCCKPHKELFLITILYINALRYSYIFGLQYFDTMLECSLFFIVSRTKGCYMLVRLLANLLEQITLIIVAQSERYFYLL